MAEISKSSMRRSKPSYFFSILGVASLLIIIGVFGWLVINGSKLQSYFRSNVQVQVYLKDEASKEDVEGLIGYIKDQAYADSVEYVSKDEAKTRYAREDAEEWDKILNFNPLPASVDFNLKPEFVNQDTLNTIAADLTQKNNVKEVGFPKNVVVNLNSTVRNIGWGLLGIVVLMGILVLILIDNTIKLAMFSNRFLIKTMQMVGATRWFISKPFDLKAVINGLISALIAIAVLIAIILSAEKWLPQIKVLRDYTLLSVLFIGIIAIGIFITFISTHRSVTKYLKMKLDDLY